MSQICATSLHSHQQRGLLKIPYPSPVKNLLKLILSGLNQDQGVKYDRDFMAQMGE